MNAKRGLAIAISAISVFFFPTLAHSQVVYYQMPSPYYSPQFYRPVVEFPPPIQYSTIVRYYPPIQIEQPAPSLYNTQRSRPGPVTVYRNAFDIVDKEQTVFEVRNDTGRQTRFVILFMDARKNRLHAEPFSLTHGQQRQITIDNHLVDVGADKKSPHFEIVGTSDSGTSRWGDVEGFRSPDILRPLELINLDSTTILTRQRISLVLGL